MYQWWVFLHLLGVFGFLLSHGASAAVAFRLRKERDPRRIQALLQISSASLSGFYVSMGMLLAGGIAAATVGNLWGYGWIWASIILLVMVTGAMYSLARPYYRRLRFVTDALVGGSEAVGEPEYASVVGSNRQLAIAGIGFAGLFLILYLMLFKPTLGMSPDLTGQAAPSSSSPALEASDVAFSTGRLVVPASRPFELVLDNRSATPHNVSIRDGRERAVFTGTTFSGPRRLAYSVPGLEAGTYEFVCDVHPQQMRGTMVAR